MKYIPEAFVLAVLVTLSFFMVWDKAFGETIDTGNILSNSTFTGGTTSWTNQGSTQQHHTMYGNECNPNTANNWATICGITKGSLATVDNGGVNQTVTLSEDTNMTTEEIQNGFTSTMSNDIWFWSGEDSVTMTQTLTDSGNNNTTQIRTVTGSHNYYQTYTDSIIVGNNTSTDYDINVKVDVDDSSNSSYHGGPDIDNIELKIAYTYINPLDEDAQDIIDDINEDISDTIDDIDWEEEEYTFDDSWQDDYSWEEEYVWYENEYTWEEDIYFDEPEFEVSDFEPPPIIDFEEMPNEIFLENEFAETSVMEEIFEEEFEEDFTSFLEDAGIEEEFAQFLEDEGMTQEEFFEEITEEEFNDEFTEESFEEFEEEFDETATIEESPPEIVETEEETMELEQESELKEQNESTEEDVQEEESDSERTEESEVQTADSEEQDSVQQEGRDDVDSDKGVATDVAKVESKLKKRLKTIAKQIARAAKINTQNLSKEDIFFKNNTTLNAYKKMQFYKSKDIYTDQNLDLFNQIDLGVYAKDIYTNITLASYTQNDPVEVHRVELYKAQEKTKRLQLELEAMKNENY
jgi:hypothetical protein